MLEKSVPGAEASTAAGGILGPHLECEGDSPFFRLCLSSLLRYPQWLQGLQEATGSEVSFHRSGGLLVAHTETEAEALRHRASSLLALGRPHRWLDPQALAAQEPALGPAHGGLFLPGEAQLDPRRLLPVLVDAARRAGVVFQSDRIKSVEGGQPGRVVGQARSYQGRDVVLAAGAWTTTLAGVSLPKNSIQPARGQMLKLRCEAPPARAILFSDTGYVIPRPDGTVLCGSTLEFEGFNKAVTEAGRSAIRAIAGELVPRLTEAPEIDAWSGLRPHTKDHLPILGWDVDSGLWFSSGHYRNGILLAPASAALVASAILGDPPEIDLTPFAPGRFRAAEGVRSAG